MGRIRGGVGRTAERASRRARRWTAAGIGGSAVVAALLLAAPLAGATGPRSFTAPFKGFTSTNYNYLSAAGCNAKASERAAPSWSATTGIFTAAGRTSGAACGTAGYSYASVSEESLIQSTHFAARHGGFGYVYVDWNQSVTANAKLTVSGKSIYASASVGGSVYLYLYDVTPGNGSYITSTTASLFGATFTGTGSYSFSTGTTSAYAFLSGTLVKGHSYQVDLYIYVDASVYLDGGSSTASAGYNLAGTHGITLTSITVY